MENEELLNQLCGTGHLALVPSLQNLARDTQTLITEGFDVEKIHRYNGALYVLKNLVACLSQLPESAGGTNTDLERTSDSQQSDVNVDVLNSKTKIQCGASKKTSIVKDLADTICWPLLRNLNPTSDTRNNVLVLLGNVCDLLIECVRCDFSNSVLNSFLESSLSFVEIYLVEKPSAADTLHNNELIDMYTLTEVLRSVLLKGCDEHMIANDSKLQVHLSKVFDKCLEASGLMDVDLVGRTCVPLLARVLRLQPDILAEKTSKLWEFVKRLTKELSKSRNDDRKIYILLCGFANYLFPVKGICAGLDLRCDREFWNLLQAGLLSKDSVNRKRSLYLIKRIVDVCETNCLEINSETVSDLASVPVFSWSKKNAASLTKIWEDVFLLLEVCEEKQVHVIKPLLSRMKKLIEATSCSNSDIPLLHTSWLTTMFSRCLHHESIQIIRWSAETVLSLDYTRCPILQQGKGEFLSGSFLYSLQEPRLFIRDQGLAVGAMPAVAERLTQFFPAVWKALPPSERGPFFSKTVQNICSGVWGPIPLVYICRGMSFVPQSPCLDRETVTGMRGFLSGFIATVDAYIRGAIQYFCVEMLLSLTDKNSTPPEEFFHILSLFHSEDCLQRGTTLWAKCSDWLTCSVDDKLQNWSVESLQNLLTTSLTKYLETTLDSKFSTGDTATAQQLSRLLLLASDAAIATRSSEVKGSTLVMVTDTLVSVINSINSHAYMSTHKADKATQLLVQLVKDLGLNVCCTADHVAQIVLKSLYSCLTEMEIYLTRQITGAFQTLSDIPVLYLYCDTLRTVIPLLSGDTQTTNLDRLTRTSVTTLTRFHKENMDSEQNLHSKLSQLVAVSILGTMAAMISETTHNAPVSQNATEPLSNSSSRNMREMICDFAKDMKLNLHFSKPVDLSQQEWGKLVSLYLQSQWEVLHLALLSSDPWCGTTELLDLAQETLSVCVGETLVPVVHCIKLLLPQVVSTQKLDDTQIQVILEACWSSLEESRRHPQYWQILSAFVEAVFQPCLMMKCEDSVVIQSLNKFASALVALGEDRNGVVNILVKQLCLTWWRPSVTEHIDKFLSLIVDLCMFGNIQKKRDRQLFDVCASIEALGNKCSVNELKDSISNQDVLIRTTIFSFLCSLNPAHTLHRHLVTGIIKLTIDRYVELSLNQSLTFVNSLVHRQRHRLVQLLLLTEYFTEDDFLPALWKFLWRSLEQEHQPSIRHMLEWEVMWLMYRHEEYRKQIWVLFEKYRESKNFVLCSLLCIVIHMGPYLPPQEQEDYYNRAIPSVLPWCLAHHFNTRIFAQATLVKLWDQCQQLELTNILKAHSILQNLVDFNQGNRNSTKNVKKLLDSFFFKFLDFRRDFSIETLFHTLPSMTGLAEEDWIAPALFIQVNREWSEGKGSCYIQLYNKTDHLKTCDPGLWRWRGGLNSYDDDAEAADDTSASLADGSGDVQKKIMPWKQMVPDEETTQEVDYGVKQRHEEGLVVVTSLISKIPNLGGLCRTSEIFGVSEYVLGKLHYTDDKAFQGLSVTAHKWLPITEVHESKLPDYLHQKRQEGYTLVGVEQTANSVCLTDYIFPVKTLLLLGNEKEGIPVDLISLLDVCVEIPQQGVIRSLNVHVSGALLIWEYRRQQLVKTKS